MTYRESAWSAPVTFDRQTVDSDITLSSIWCGLAIESGGKWTGVEHFGGKVDGLSCTRARCFAVLAETSIRPFTVEMR